MRKKLSTGAKPRIYLAGPDVFVPDPDALVKAKKAILAPLGLEGCAPVDNNLKSANEYESAQELAADIARQNFKMMDVCDSCICQLTPYHGVSADVGTTGELHYMYAQGKPVFAYTNDDRPFYERVRDDRYKGQITRKTEPYFQSEIQRGEDGLLVEDFGLFDNLMIPFAITNSGGSLHSCMASKENYYTDLTAFEEAAKAAATWFRENGIKRKAQRGAQVFLLMQILFVVLGVALFFGLKTLKESRTHEKAVIENHGSSSQN